MDRKWGEGFAIGTVAGVLLCLLALTRLHYCG